MNSTIKMYDDGDHHHHRYHSESTFSTYHRHGKFPSSSLSSEQFGFNHRKSSSIRQQLQTSRDEKNTANNNIFNATKSSSIILTQSECKSSSSDQETNEHYQQNHYCDEFRNDHQDLIRSYHSSNNHCLRKSSNQYWRRNDSRISNHFDQRLTMKRFIRRPYVLLMILIMIALSSFDQYGIVVDAEKIVARTIPSTKSKSNAAAAATATSIKVENQFMDHHLNIDDRLSLNSEGPNKRDLSSWSSDLSEGSGSSSSHHHHSNPNRPHNHSNDINATRNPSEDDEDDDDEEDDLDLEESSGFKPKISADDGDDEDAASELVENARKPSSVSSTTTSTATSTSSTSTSTTTIRPLTTTKLSTTTKFSTIKPKKNCKLPIDDEDVVEGSGDCTTTGDDDSVGNNTDDLIDDPVEGSGDRNEDSVPSSNSVTDKPIVHSPSVPEESLDSIVNRATESSSTTSSTTMSSSSPSFSPTPSTPFPESEITSIDDGNDDYPFISPKFTPPRIPSAAPSFFARPGILAAVIGGTVVGLLCAILMVMFIVYRMRKKDEGSYPIDKAMKYRVGSNKHYA